MNKHTKKRKKVKSPKITMQYLDRLNKKLLDRFKVPWLTRIALLEAVCDAFRNKPAKKRKESLK